MSLELTAPQLLTTAHRVDDFSCGEPILDEWLKRRAMANQAGGASRTFVVVDRDNRVYGYYAVAAGAVSHQMATGGVRRNMPDPIPVMVLARLAVDHRAHTTPYSRIAYKLQEDALGGLSPDMKRRLTHIGAKHSKIKARRQTREIHLAPGTVLVREWGNRDHQVTVTAAGTFDYEGRHFKSLSAVARHISGTQWSGPLFFGLRRAGEGDQ